MSGWNKNPKKGVSCHHLLNMLEVESPNLKKNSNFFRMLFIVFGGIKIQKKTGFIFAIEVISRSWKSSKKDIQWTFGSLQEKTHENDFTKQKLLTIHHTVHLKGVIIFSLSKMVQNKTGVIIWHQPQQDTVFSGIFLKIHPCICSLSDLIPPKKLSLSRILSKNPVSKLR